MCYMQLLKPKGKTEEGKCTHFIPFHSLKISHYHMGSCFAGLWIRIKDFVSSVLRTFHHFFLQAWKCNLKYFTRENFSVWKIISLCASICNWNQCQSWFSSDSHKGILIFTRNRLCLHVYTYCIELKKELGILCYLSASLLLFVLPSLIPSITCKAQTEKSSLPQGVFGPHLGWKSVLDYSEINTECELINREREGSGKWLPIW